MPGAMTADFYADWIEILRQHLLAAGYAVPLGDKPESVCIRYFNLGRRLLPARPREVHEADTLSRPPVHAPALQVIREKIELGVSLTPHLSRRLTNPDYNDPLLNDWGIHHLHLNNLLQPDGFTDRTGSLLFARFTDEAAYLIAILDHQSWTKQAMLETILRNWPELLERDRLKGFASRRPGSGLTDAEISTLRSKNAMGFVTLSNDLIYAPMGGGYTSSGLNVQVFRSVDIYTTATRAAQEWVMGNIVELRQLASEQGRRIPADPRFKLVDLQPADGVAVARVLELHSKMVFEVPTVRWR